MNIASIDIGSNTVLLLIATYKDKRINPIVNLYKSPRLGKDLVIGGKILDGRIDQLIQILKYYKEIIQKYNCKYTVITATNAMRIASNSTEIVNLVKNKLNLDIRIIPGNDEAELSYLGASSSKPEIKEKMVIDIGGGSTEIVYGNGKNIVFKESFQIGVVSLTEKHLSKFPYSNLSIFEASNYSNSIFSKLSAIIPKNIPTIAVAGTPTTLSCIKQNLKEFDENKVENSILTLNEIKEITDTLSGLNGIQIIESFGNVVYGREDVLYAGSIILRSIMNATLVDKIYISNRGLRYGNIINYIDCL